MRQTENVANMRQQLERMAAARRRERSRVLSDAQTRARELEAEADRLEKARKALGELNGRVRHPHRSRVRRASGEPRPKRDLTPAKIAGPANIKLVADELAKRGKASQSELVRAIGRNSGTVSYALQALEGDSKAKRTGEKVGRSAEWQWTGGRSRTVRPGS